MANIQKHDHCIGYETNSSVCHHQCASTRVDHMALLRTLAGVVKAENEVIDACILYELHITTNLANEIAASDIASFPDGNQAGLK